MFLYNINSKTQTYHFTRYELVEIVNMVIDKSTLHRMIDTSKHTFLSFPFDAENKTKTERTEVLLMCIMTTIIMRL